MLKPRPLPPAHKNQLFVPTKSIGFFNDHTTQAFFRHYEITKKRLKPKPAGIFAPSNHHTHDQHDSVTTRDMTSSVTSLRDMTSSVTSHIHIRGRNSVTDVSDVTLKLKETPRKTPTPPDKDDVKGMTSFLTEDPTSSRSYDGGSSSSFSSPVLECSKYSIIGEPSFRKKRAKRNEWTLPRLREVVQGHGTLDNAGHPKTNTIDVKSIYGSDSKLLQVPPTEAKRENSVILPPLEVGRRREAAAAVNSLDAHCLAEKRLVRSIQHHHRHHHPNVCSTMVHDQVPMPTSYKPYFRFKQQKHKFVRSLFATGDLWENNRAPVRCSRCVHQSKATLHYCDVLGKRFCRFCSEMTERNFSQAYEGNRLLVPSPHKSPTLQMLKEPSFIGVRKIAITKTTKQESQGHDQGHRDLEASDSGNHS
ncbi:hypothetical protein ACOMHN_007708 [Nucella lapillus]